MLIKDIKEKINITEDDCELCSVHDYMENSAVKCPSCGSDIDYEPYDIKPVGETNSADEDEEIKNMPVINCSCGDTIAFYPMKIIYNGNHDVYYTGGKSYLTDYDLSEIVGDRLLPSIQQYHDRILAGEKLEPINLNTWLKYRIESAISEYLYKKGLKK